MKECTVGDPRGKSQQKHTDAEHWHEQFLVGRRLFARGGDTRTKSERDLTRATTIQAVDDVLLLDAVLHTFSTFALAPEKSAADEQNDGQRLHLAPLGAVGYRDARQQRHAACKQRWQEERAWPEAQRTIEMVYNFTN